MIVLPNKSLLELYRHIDKIAETLGCSPAELCISKRSLPTYQTKMGFKDILIKSVDLYPVKEVRYRRNGIYNHHNVGIQLLETRSGRIKYAAINVHTKTGIEMYLCLKQKDTYRFYRNIARQERNYQKTIAVLPILDEVFIKQILDNTLGFFQHEKKLVAYGAKIKRGIILSGLPGNGKTMLCKYISAIAASRAINVYNINASHIEKAFQDDNLGGLLNREGFTFVDDVDVAYFTRTGAKATIACSLLSAMDGLDSDKNTVRIFTTNEDINDIDDAFLRPGRIDKSFTFSNPSAEMRRKFVKTWHKDIVAYIDKKKCIDILVNHTEGMSFAELDLIRTCLVEEFLEDGKWDIDKAIRTTQHRLENKQENERRRVGFGFAQQPKEFGASITIDDDDDEDNDEWAKLPQ